MIILLMLVVSSCLTSNETSSNNQLHDTDKVLNEFLYSSIDSITKGYNLKNNTLVYHDIYPDNVKRMTINGVIESNPGSTSKKIMLLNELIKIVDDSVHLNIAEKESTVYSFYYKEASISEKVDFESNSFFGSISLTNVAFNSSRDFAGYYIGLQCGNKCGGGYIVFIDKKDSNWVLNSIVPVWGAKPN